jgi:hypothetical protein
VGSANAPVSNAQSTAVAAEPSVDIERAGASASVIPVSVPGLPCAFPRSVG